MAPFLVVVALPQGLHLQQVTRTMAGAHNDEKLIPDHRMRHVGGRLLKEMAPTTKCPRGGFRIFVAMHSPSGRLNFLVKKTRRIGSGSRLSASALYPPWAFDGTLPCHFKGVDCCPL